VAINRGLRETLHPRLKASVRYAAGALAADAATS
jgi:hypothetical protein